ncbi:NADH dehydrogenase [ubiquinone] 1 beta subcomplex subunit 1 [Diorhabda carinulata]|uniref:NADH dehydrogenase [ubiquinone] 1 beta subcomplex subunit 1 n=1 Tax=Diorhabda sublineata TaxID=1163346 RepID=UPI0024E057B1|nr:NADH dehydrogenase [ubiquinone] 1 beta subcomplex subunit 1 [Diorhabda sublineata]XP_057671848.1 NADH dehydrogenase [ubiquinone] 1 beta subcomplex subunit 1 [Diorhabda carinulata]
MFYPIIPKGIGWGILPVIGLVTGWYLDRLETERLTLFRDKSALYGRELKEGEKPSW